MSEFQIKHFDDPTLTVLRQLDDIAQEFDPAHKITFLSQTLHSALPMIPEPLWFNRILQRFNENLPEYVELYSAILRPLMYMLNNCESHNIYKLRAWFRRITANCSNEEVRILTNRKIKNLNNFSSVEYFLTIYP